MFTKFKNYSKYVIGVAVIALVATGILWAASGQVTIPLAANLTVGSTTKAYANSQIDTVIFSREGSLSALAFGTSFKDSVSLTNIVCRRVVDGQLMAVVVGDTISGAFASASNTGAGLTSAVTLAPLADQYWFIVKYAASANGVSTATAKYEAIKQFSRR